MDVTPGEISLEEMRGYVEQAFGLQAEEKGLRLSVTLDPALPRTIITDAQRLQQILRNLLSNAVKFTESGSVTLSIARTRTAQGPLRRSQRWTRPAGSSRSP